MDTSPTKPDPLRKKIRVRKNTLTEQKWNYDDEYIPVSAQDSKWSGIAFNSDDIKDNPVCGSTTEDECEIKIIDLESPNGTPPLLILFPDLRNEESLEHVPGMAENMSTSSLTKLLRGKKPKMDLLKASRKLNKPNTLSTVREGSSHTCIRGGIVTQDLFDIDLNDVYKTHSLPKTIKE